MKKVFGIGSCMVGIVLVISGAVMKLKGQTAVTVIGGADGPTAVFVAGKLNGDRNCIVGCSSNCLLEEKWRKFIRKAARMVLAAGTV